MCAPTHKWVKGGTGPPMFPSPPPVESPIRARRVPRALRFISELAANRPASSEDRRDNISLVPGGCRLVAAPNVAFAFMGLRATN